MDACALKRAATDSVMCLVHVLRVSRMSDARGPARCGGGLFLTTARLGPVWGARSQGPAVACQRGREYFRSSFVLSTRYGEISTSDVVGTIASLPEGLGDSKGLISVEVSSDVHAGGRPVLPRARR